MRFVLNLSSVLVIAIIFTACGGSGGSDDASTSATADSTNLVNEPVNTGNIPSITPSTQSSDEIVSIIRNAGNDIPYEEIDTGIEQASGNGPFYAVDENGKMVLMAFMSEKYFGKNNWVFCHESSNDCFRVVDNSGNQRFTGTTQFADGKLFMLNFDKRVDPGEYGKTLAYYDPNTKTLVKNALDIHGLNGGSAMTKGTDGYLYLSGCNYGTPNHYAAYARVNPKDLTDFTYYTDYYKDLGVERTRDIGVDETHVYQAMGDTPWELIAIDKNTQQSVKLLEGKFFDTQQLKDGVALVWIDSDGNKKYAWLFNGEVYPTDSLDSTPPWYSPATHPNNHPTENPTGYWAYKGYWDIDFKFKKPKITSLQLEAKSVSPGLGEIKMGALINEVQFDFALNVDMYVQPVTRIQKIDENRIMLKGRAYSGFSVLNTNDDSTKYLGLIHISANVHKPFLDYSDNKKKFMMSGYPSATTATYTLDDTNKKFSKDNVDSSLGYLRKIADRNNPGDGIDIDIHRTTGMVQINEMVYFIGMQYRSGVGGALIVWNTVTNEKYAFKKGIFDNYQPRDMIRIGDNLAIATQAMDNTKFGGTARPSTPKILIFDPIRERVVKEYTPVEGFPALDTGRIQSIDGRHIIGLTNNGGTPDNDTPSYSSRMFLYMIDTYTDEIVMKKSIEMRNYMRVEPSGSAFIDGFHFIKDGDYIYTWTNARTLSTIDKNGKLESHGLLPYEGTMAFANGSIYITGDKKLRKIDDPKR